MGKQHQNDSENTWLEKPSHFPQVQNHSKEITGA
jgi:hypothetical protein